MRIPKPNPWVDGSVDQFYKLLRSEILSSTWNFVYVRESTSILFHFETRGGLSFTLKYNLMDPPFENMIRPAGLT